jgi:transcriptional regulator with XRE-family HTH domain
MADFDSADDRCRRYANSGAVGTSYGRCEVHGERPPPLPEHAWNTGELRGALQARDIGGAIRAYRRHPHHGRRRITQDEMARWLSITQGHLSRIERGRMRVSNLEALTSYARVLGIPPRLLWFDLPADHYTPPPEMRHSGPLPHRLAETITAPTENHLAEAMLSTLAGHSARDQLEGPHDLLDVVRRDIAFLDQRLTGGHNGSAGGARLRYVAGRFAELLGWLHQDCGDLEAAQRWSASALARAEASEDVRFRAYVLMRSSNIATDTGDWSSATRFIEEALLHAGALTSRQRAVLLRQQANVYAARAARSGRSSDAAACVDALARASEAAAEPATEPDDLAAYCSPAYVSMEAAHCWIQMGHPDKALTLMQQRLDDWSADNRRDLGMGLARLSTAHAGVGSWPETMEVAAHAATIVADTGSYRTLRQLYTTATVLRVAGRAGDARELTHQLRAVSRARTSHGRLQWN